MQHLKIVKIGGNVVNDASKLHRFLNDFSKLDAPKILIHGGGILATTLAEKLAIKQTITDGRRVTDAATLELATMVYAGGINKNIVATLQPFNCNAIGLSGADGNLILGHKRLSFPVDYGFVGDIDTVNTKFLQLLFDGGFLPVISPIIHDGQGQLLNTNADTIATEIAKALATIYDVELIFCFEKVGVLTDVFNENSLIENLNFELYQNLKKDGFIANGMIPKLQNGFSALQNNVKFVRICHSDAINQKEAFKGTTLSL